MRRCSLILFVVGLSLAAPLVSAKAPPAVGSKSSATLSEEALYGRHVSVLASEEMGGRKPGTPGARKARAYLVAQLRGLGLKAAFGGNYSQPFTLTLGTKAETQQLRAVGADKIDSAGAVRILNVVDRLVESLAVRADRIAYTAPRPGSGRRVLLGVRFDPGASGDGGGVRLAEIVKDMPAAKAGLRQGDVVTGWADKAIGGVADMRAALAKVKPGDTVRLTVLRGKEKVQVSVEFPKR